MTSAPNNVSDSDGIVARQVAFGLLNDIFFKRRSFDEALAGSRGFEELSSRDRAFVRLLVATVLKHARQMDAVLQHFLKEPTLKPATLINIFRLGMAQLVFLKTPEHAAVNTTVELAEAEGIAHQKPLVNAIMRRLAREGFPVISERDAGKLSTPEWLWVQWMKDYGVETALDIAAANLGEASLDISVKSNPEAWAEKLEATLLPTGSLRKYSQKTLSRSAGEGGDPHSGEGEGAAQEERSCGATPSPQPSPAGREREHRTIPELPGFAEGEWWIQNAAAALPAKLFGDIAGKTVVDLCAAPGGKTAQLCAEGAKVIALDRSAQRVARLKENMTRLKFDIETVIADGAEWRPSTLVDAVLLDAPCTATGTIRHQPDILHLKEMKDQEKLAALQRRLIINAVNMLKPGGVLIYCTCSIQKAESEEQVDWLLSQNVALKLSPITAEEVPVEFLTARGEIRCLPQHWEERGGIDGFFVVRFIKQ